MYHCRHLINGNTKVTFSQAQVLFFRSNSNSFTSVRYGNNKSDYILAHTIYQQSRHRDGEVTLPLLIAHGLLGSGENFHKIAKSLGIITRRAVVTFDAVNHGRSPHREDMSYEIMTEDLERLVKYLRIRKFSLLGHSMGGRTCMMYALKNPDQIDRLMIIGASPLHNSNLTFMKCYIEAMMAVKFDSSVKSLSQARKLADRMLLFVVENPSVRTFFVRNLAQDGDGNIYWKANLQSLFNNLDKLEKFPAELLTTKFTRPTLFLKGEYSTYLPMSDFKIIRKTFRQGHLHIVRDTGHWPHFDNPQLFIRHIAAFILNS